MKRMKIPLIKNSIKVSLALPTIEWCYRHFCITKIYFTIGTLSFPLLLFLFLSITLFAQGERKIRFGIDNNYNSIVITSINGYEYFSFENQKHNSASNALGNFIYSFGDYQIQFLPGSFFFVLKGKDKTEMIFQLNRPILSFKDKLLIPFRSFLSCLSSSGKFDSTGNNLAISFKTKSHLEVTQKTESFKEKQSNKKSNEERKSSVARESSMDKRKTKFTEVEESAFPRVLLTERERFSLKKMPFAVKETKPQPNITLPQSAKDTTKVPPKFYVLPPELKNNPK
jgi:hypothetical protein